MARSAAPDGKRKRLAPRWLKWIAGIVLLLAMPWAAMHIYFGLCLRAELKAIRKAGFPVDLAELDAWYPTPPPGQNAADIYERAFALVVPEEQDVEDVLPFFGKTLPPHGHEFDAEEKAAIANFLERNAGALELLHKGGAWPESRYPLRLSQGFSMPLPHLEGVWQSARLLALKAIYEANDGDAERAFGCIADAVRLAGSLRREPLTASQCCRHYALITAMHALSLVLAQAAPTEGHLDGLEPLLEAAQEPDAYALCRAFAGERCFNMPAFEDPRGSVSMMNVPPTKIFLKVMPIYGISGLRGPDRVTYLYLMRRAIEATRLPPPERFEAMRRLDRDVAYAAMRLCVVTLTVAPYFRSAARCEAVSLTRVRCARTALAIERYRLRTNKLPDRLEELVPTCIASIPQDPFDGKPLRYRKLPLGYVVYSVGDDRQDDGGEEQDEGTWPDVPFVVAR